MRAIFFWELRFNWLSLILWSMILLSLILFGVIEFPVVMSSIDTLERALSAIPEPVRIMFGIYEEIPLSTPLGYFICMFMWYSLVAFAHAAIVGTSITTKEERNHTAEFLFTKPVPRAKVVSVKIWVAFLHVLIMNLLTWISSILTMGWVIKDPSIYPEINQIMIGMFFSQLMFLAIGLMFSAVFKKGSTAVRWSILTVVLSYVISIWIEYSGIHGFTVLSPSWYFNAPSLISDGFNPFYILLASLMISLSIWVTYKWYEKRDLNC